MRVPLIAGNWKMNTTLTEAIALVQTMYRELDEIGNEIGRASCRERV